MSKHFLAAVSAMLLLAASYPAQSDAQGMPGDKAFPSSIGEVVFKHKEHVQDRGIKCVDCHHQINAKKLTIPHPDYFKSSSLNCDICHNPSEKLKQSTYVCSECHRTNPADIADETLSAKVVIHKKCWQCHQVTTGKDASKSCGSCHSGKKTP